MSATRNLSVSSEISGAGTASLIDLSEIDRQHRSGVGNKTGRLSELIRAGFAVPAGFCIPQEVYIRHMQGIQDPDLRALIHARAFAGIRSQIQQLKLDPAMQAQIIERYRRLLAAGNAGGAVHVAVRSSSTAEDMQSHSFAGVYESVLHVGDEAALLQAVLACWASYWSDEAINYRERAGLDHLAYGMAVLVQVMIPPVLSGVFFTRASSQDEHTALIEYVPGVGAGLMNGETRAERLLVERRSGRLLAPSPLEAEMDVSRLVSLGLSVERNQGAPQDIEWLVDRSGKIWILQTRPITIYPEGIVTPVDGSADDWRITYDEPFSTLGCEIALHRYEQWIRAINASFRTHFKPEMRNLDGLLYYKPYWRRTGPSLRMWMRLWQIVLWLRANRIHRQYTHQILPAHRQRLFALEQVDITSAKWTELVEGFTQAVDAYLQFQYTSYAVGAAATLSAGFFNRICQLFFRGENRWNALDFLAGLNDISVRREMAVDSLGQKLRRFFTRAELAELDYTRLLTVQKKGEPGQRYWGELQAFLDEYGYVWADRYPRDPAWELNQDALAASLQHAALAGSDATLFLRHQRQQKRRREAIRRATMRLSNRSLFPWRVFIFRLFFRRAEKIFPYKEDRNHHTYRSVLVIRRYALEIGRRLAERQILSDARDVFFLTMEEIQQMWTVTRPLVAQLRAVEARKQRYLRSRQRVQHPAQVRDWDHRPEAAQGTQVEVKGEACSPGLAQGPARLVSGLGELQRIRPGDIVICTQLRPAWSSVFARAGGVVIEMGSLLSHGSTLAREYGIPVVINVAGIMQTIQENDWVVVDGNLGKVRIVKPSLRNS